jgi:hypothetical protein
MPSGIVSISRTQIQIRLSGGLQRLYRGRPVDAWLWAGVESLAKSLRGCMDMMGSAAGPRRLRACSVIIFLGREGDICYDCEVVLCQRREPTFNQPQIEGSFCDAEGGRIRRSESWRWGTVFCPARSARRVSRGAQKMIDHTVKLNVSRQAIVLRIRLNRWPSARFSRLMILGWVAWGECSVIAEYIPQ